MDFSDKTSLSKKGKQDATWILKTEKKMEVMIILLGCHSSNAIRWKFNDGNLNMFYILLTQDNYSGFLQFWSIFWKWVI